MAIAQTARDTAAATSALLGVISVWLVVPTVRDTSAGWPIQPWVLQAPCALIGAALAAVSVRGDPSERRASWGRSVARFGLASNLLGLIEWIAILVFAAYEFFSRPFIVVGPIAPH